MRINTFLFLLQNPGVFSLNKYKVVKCGVPENLSNIEKFFRSLSNPCSFFLNEKNVNLWIIGFCTMKDQCCKTYMK